MVQVASECVNGWPGGWMESMGEQMGDWDDGLCGWAVSEWMMDG